MTDDAFSLRSSLSITTMSEENDTTSGTETTIPLRTSVLSIVKSSPNYTIRAAKVSQELGLSINDASAELCGLLQVVPGSTFSFEVIDGVQTMVFTFPSNFEQRALQHQTQDDLWQTCIEIAKAVSKVLKIITAFGLILSTVIVSIAGMVGLVAALVAMSRGGGGGDSRASRHHVSRQLHNLFYTIRQLVWCYAMFGSSDNNEQDPFFRETAYDSWLMMSLCCGNPSSLWFWMRAGHLRRRRRRIARGWGRRISTNTTFFDDTASDLEGVSLIRRSGGTWGEADQVLPAAASSLSSEEHRGLLSVAVEFLFGPTKSPGPLEEDKWRLRGAVIVEKNGPMALSELSPYVDRPPASLEDTAQVASQGLLLVAHFNGVPSKKSKDRRLFEFPELLAETHVNVRYDGGEPVDEDGQWEGLFYVKDDTASTSTTTTITGLPKYLHEERHIFTKLSSKQFFHCLLVAVLNFLGVVWFAQSLQPGNILEQFLNPTVTRFLTWSLIPVLVFYSKLFFAIPTVRLLFVLVRNKLSQTRNLRRKQLVAAR